MSKAMQESRTLMQSSRFLVGRDSGGHWVVTDGEGLIGGQFADRSSAVQFAMFESDHIPGAVRCVPDDIVISPGPQFKAAATRTHRTVSG